MSYKRVVEKRGKSYGPYIYESYRDPKTGKVKKRYLGKIDEGKKSKSFFVLIGLVAFATLVAIGCSTDFLLNEGEYSQKVVGQTKNVVSTVGDFFSDSYYRITGFSVEGGDGGEGSGGSSGGDSGGSSSSDGGGASGGSDSSSSDSGSSSESGSGSSSDSGGSSESGSQKSEEKVEKKETKAEEKTQKEQAKSEDIVSAGITSLESEVSNEEVTEEPVVEESQEEVSEEQVQVEEPVEQEGSSGGGSGGGVVVVLNESEVVEQNVTEGIVNETEINETETVSNETIAEEGEQNTGVESNETEIVVNETEIVVNETEIVEEPNETIEEVADLNVTIEQNETEISMTELNISAEQIVNYSTLQFKAVIKRPVRWIKKINITGNNSNISVELPRNATNISILTGDEIQIAIAESSEYEEILNETNREELALGEGITGFVSFDIDNNEGVLIKVWKWLTGFTISGNVVLEDEIESEIFETDNATVVDLSGVVSAEQEVAVSYYTDAPVSDEMIISGGKKIDVSADDSFNYTDILAYTVLYDSLGMDHIPMNDSRLKLYWYASKEDAIAYGYISPKEVNVTMESNFTSNLTESNQTETNETMISLEDETEEISESVEGENLTNSSVSEVLNESVSEVVQEADLVNETITETEENQTESNETEKVSEDLPIEKESVVESEESVGEPEQPVESEVVETEELSGDFESEITEVEESSEVETEGVDVVPVTGEIVQESGGLGFFSRFFYWVEMRLGLTGNVVDSSVIEEVNLSDIDLGLEENLTSFVDDSYAEEISIGDSEVYRIEVDYVSVDFDEDGYVDYIEWIVPHLSLQSYEVVFSDVNMTATNITYDNNYAHLTIGNESPYDSLVAYYSFDADNENTETTTHYDFSSSSNDGVGVYNSVVNNSDCIYGDCAHFDAIDDCISVPFSQSLNFSLTDKITVGGWVKLNSSQGGSGNWHTLISKGSSSSRAGFRLIIDIDNIYFDLKNLDDSCTGYAYATGLNLYDGAWHHIFGVYNDSNLLIYLDGSLTGSTPSCSGNITGNSESIYISYSARELNGSADEMMVFNNSLTLEQVQAIYNNQSARFVTAGQLELKQFNFTAGDDSVFVDLDNYERNADSNISARVGEWDVSKGYDDSLSTTSGDLNYGLVGYWHLDELVTNNFTESSGLFNNGTLIASGSTSNLSGGIFSDSVNLDGAGDYVDMGTDSSIREDLNNSMTISAWVNRNGDGTGLEAIVSSCNDIGAYGYYFAVYQNDLRMQLAGAGAYAVAQTTDNMGNGVWVHVVGTYNGSDIGIYRNGILQGLDTDTKGSGTFGAVADKVVIGARDSGLGNFFNGTIDEVLLFNRSLSSDEIKEIYVKGRALYSYTEKQNITPVDAGDTNSFNQFTISTSSTNLIRELELTSNSQFYTPFILNGTATMNTSINDTVVPNVTIDLPESKIYNATVSFNVTALDSVGIDSCLYSLSNGAVNYTMIDSTANYYNDTNISMVDGTYTVNFYCNDSSNNLNNSESVSIIVDAVKPTINFTTLTPANASTQSNDNIFVNMTTNDTNDHFVFTNFDNSLVSWWRMDDVNNSGRVVESAYGINNGTSYGDAIQIDSGKFGKGWSFDGDDDAIILPSFSLTSDTNFLAVSFWVNFSLDPTYYQTPIGDSAQSNDIGYIWCYRSPNGNSLTWQYAKGGSRSDWTATNIFSGYDGQWVHIVGVFDYTNGIGRFYRNGILYDNEDDATTAIYPSTNRAKYIGGYSATTHNVNGTMDEFMFFNRNLSDLEISALYNASANQYYHNFTELSDGAHGFTGYVVDVAGNVNQTFNRTVTVENTGTDITICRDLNTANSVYTLQNDISTTGNCINVTAENVTIDCDGLWSIHWEDAYAIWSDEYNTTVQNCTFDGVVVLPSDSYSVHLKGNHSSVYNSVEADESAAGGTFFISGFYNNLWNLTTSGKVSANARVEVVSNYSSIYDVDLNNDECANDANRRCSIISGDNNNITSFDAGSDSGYGTIFVTGNNLTLDDINLSFSCSGEYNQFAIHNSSIIDVYGEPDGCYGPAFSLTGSDNNFTDSYVGYGSDNGDQFIQISGSRNILQNVSAYDSDEPGNSAALYVTGSNNEIYNGTFAAGFINSGSTYGTVLITGNYNLLQYCNITGYDSTISPGADGLAIQGGDNNIIKDSYASSLNTNFNATVLDGAVNNTLINVTYGSDDLDKVVTGGDLTRKWYYRAYVNDSLGNFVENANVTAFNSSGHYAFNSTTDNMGYTATMEITEYTKTVSGTSYYSNYTIYSANSTYNLSSSLYNVTIDQNNYIHNIQMSTSTTTIACGVLDMANSVYTIQNTLQGSGTCLNVTAENVTIDCNGQEIDWAMSGTGAGVYSNEYNTSISGNCIFNDELVGGTSLGSVIIKGDYANVTNIDVSLYGGGGDYITISGDYARIRNITFSEDSSTSNLLDSRGNYAWIENLDFKDSSTARPIYFSGNNSNITDLYFDNCGGSVGLMEISGNNDSVNAIHSSVTNGEHEILISTTNSSFKNFSINSGGNQLFTVSGNNNIFDSIAGVGSVSGAVLYLSGNYNRFNNITILSDTITYTGVYASGSYNNITNSSITAGFYGGVGPTSGVVNLIGAGNYLEYCNISTYPNADSGTHANAVYIPGLNNKLKNALLVGNRNATYVDGGTNTIFTNVTYVSGDEWVNSGNLKRKWYYQVYVNDSGGNGVNGANVTAYRNGKDIDFSSVANSTGGTSVQELSEYVNDAGAVSYYSPYIFTATNSTNYGRNESYNATTMLNKFDNVITMDVEYPSASIYSPLNSSSYNSSSVLFNVSSSEESTGMIVPNLDNSLVSWWRMDDVNNSGNVVEYVYGINNGTTYGNANRTDSGKFGYGWEFDGTQGYIDAGNVEVIGEITLAVWVNMPNPSSGTYGVLDKKRWQSATYKNDYAFMIRNGGFDVELGNSTDIVRKTGSLGLSANTWAHVVITYNKTTFTVYNDGNSIYTNDFSLGDSGISSSTTTLFIGNRRTSTWYPFNGTIDEVMVFNRSLSSSEVVSLYNATSSQFNQGGLNDGDHNYKIYTQDLASNVFSSTTNDFLVDTYYPTINFTTLTPENATTVADSSIFVNMTTNDTNDHYSFVDLDNSLIAWWTMDEQNDSGSLVDWSSYSNNGTTYGNANQTDTGKFGKAWTFDGSGDYVDVNSLDSPTNGSGNLSISGWIKTPVIGKTIVSNWYNDAPPFPVYRGWQVTTINGNLTFVIGGPSVDGYVLLKSITNVTDDNWHFFTVTWNTTNASIYVDGEIETSGSYSLTGLASQQFRIGDAFNDFSEILGGDFNGLIDDMMLFNRVLSSTEIKSIYNASANQYYHNFTELSDGAHGFTGYVVDVAGNVNQTFNRTVTVDTGIPTPSIVYPVDSTDYPNYMTELNYTIDSADYCWYTNDAGVTNSSTQTPGLNWSDLNISVRGSNTWTVYCNDSADNLGSDSVTFSVDDISPEVNFTNPTLANLSVTSGESNLFVNVSSNDTNDHFVFTNFDNSLVAWWRMDDVNNSGNVVEYVYGINNGTTYGNANRTDSGKFGYGWTFDGDGDYIELTLTEGNNSVSLWYAENDSSWTHVVYNSTTYVYNGTALGLDEFPFNRSDDTVKIGVNGSKWFNGTIDEVLIFNRSLSSTEILALYNASANQYSNNFTELSDGNHTVKAYTSDSAGNINVTEERTIATIGNTAPDSPTVYINSTANMNYTNETLYCSANITDLDADTMDVTVYWYNDSILALTQDYNNSYANGTLFIADLGPGNTTKGDLWNCTLRLYDGVDYILSDNSTTLTIVNSPPIVTLSSPVDDSSTSDRTPTFTWSASDADNDGMTYEINVTPYYAGDTTGFEDVRNEAGLADVTYTPLSDLQYLSDSNYYYLWTVRADDGTVNGSWTTLYALNISSFVEIQFVTGYDEANFGSINPLISNDTTDNSPTPLILENSGTVLANITVNSTSLWESVDVNSEYYMFKVDNNTIGDEGGSFNWGLSNTGWTQFPTTGSVIAIAQLNYTDETDTAEVDIYIDTPEGEQPGTRGALVIFTSSLGE